MPFDLAFDPVTQDEIDDGTGSPKLTERADTAVMHAFLCHYGECWHDPEMGSRFHSLDFAQRNPVPLAQDEARRVLERLESQGRIADAAAVVELDPRGIGRINVATRFRDTNSGQLVATKIRTGG